MAHECVECTLVNSAESIYVDPKIRRELTEKPVSVGKFTMPGWIGHAGFYAFACPDCGCVTVDYPHGYTDEGQFYFHQAHSSDCKTGGEETTLPINDPEIYKGEGVKLSKKDIEILKRAEMSDNNSKSIIWWRLLLWLGIIAVIVYIVSSANVK